MPLCKDYRDFLDAQTHLKDSSIKSISSYLSIFPDFEDLDADWIRQRMREVAPATIHTMMYIIKQLYAFHDRPKDDIEKVRLPKNGPTVTVEDLYTREELLALFEATDNTRDRALLEVLYESACRASELLSMTIENVSLNKDGTADVIVSGKTGTREVPIFHSVPALKAWLNVHPIGEGPIWVSLRAPDGAVGYQTVYALVMKYLDRAGIQGKQKLLHMFRHTRITELVNNGISGVHLQKLVGWRPGSNMEAVYVHLSNQDVKKEVRTKMFGFPAEQEKDEPLMRSVQCPSCGTMNEPMSRVCVDCSAPLRERADRVAELEDIIRELQGYLRENDESMARMIAEVKKNTGLLRDMTESTREEVLLTRRVNERKISKLPKKLRGRGVSSNED